MRFLSYIRYSAVRCGFVSTDMDGCCIAIATAWVVYEFV